MYILCLGGTENIGFEKYFAEIVGVLANLLVISLVFIAYLVYQIRQKSPGAKARQQAADMDNNSGNVHVNDSNGIDASTYEQMGDEQSYTGLNRSDVGEYDDRSYAHLNQVVDVYVMQEETGI